MTKHEHEDLIDLNAIIPAGDDAVLPFAVEGLDIRGRAIQMGAALDAIIDGHGYPEPVARLLGEMIVLTVLLGTSLKFDGQFIVQTQTDGPVNLLIVDFRTPGDVRAYARFDEGALVTAVRDNAIEPEQLLGKGILAMTVDQGQYMQRYQGMVSLEGQSLEDVAHAYFVQSEQIPTRVRLGVAELIRSDDEGFTRSSWRAGGVLVQFLPESEDRIKHRDLPGGDGDDLHISADDNAWIEAQTLLATVRDDELTDPSINAERLLFHLFHEQDLRLFQPQDIREKCSCTSEKIWGVLKTMSEVELAELAEDNKIEVKCEFCGSDYTVTTDQLALMD